MSFFQAFGKALPEKAGAGAGSSREISSGETGISLSKPGVTSELSELSSSELGASLLKSSAPIIEEMSDGEVSLVISLKSGGITILQFSSGVEGGYKLIHGVVDGF
jgi:hypothetical protein